MSNNSNIAYWIDEGRNNGATHVIVVFDAMTNQQFPVYVMPGENFEAKRAACNQGSCSVEADFTI